MHSPDNFNSPKGKVLGIHAQNSHNLPDGQHVLGVRSTLLCAATGYVLEQNPRQTALFVTGKANQPIGELMRETVIKRGIEPRRIQASCVTMDTGGEVREFIKATQQTNLNPQNDLDAMAAGSHTRLVNFLYSQYCPGVPVYSADNIINLYGTQQEKDIQERLLLSRHETSLKTYQTLVYAFTRLVDKRYTVLGSWSTKDRKQFTVNPWPSFLRRIFPEFDPLTI